MIVELPADTADGTTLTLVGTQEAASSTLSTTPVTITNGRATAAITVTNGEDTRTYRDDYVFRRKGMKLPMTPSTFTWRFKKILKANDLPTDLNVHSLRHTAASLFIASGTDVGTVAGLLGHSQPSTTLDIYTHAFDKNKKRQVRSCRAVWKSEFSIKKLRPVVLCSKSKVSEQFHIKIP